MRQNVKIKKVSMMRPAGAPLPVPRARWPSTCAPPASAELCGGSQHADNTKYEPVAVYHELSEGTFRGFCAKSTASLTYSRTPNPAKSWS